MSFTELGLSETVLKAVADAGYTVPTPIQAQAIPVVLMGRDVLGCAQTGTGKTAGFTLPMIDILSTGRAKARMPRSLILEPTRELAAQVAENFDKYGKNSKLAKALIIGGESMEPQERLLDRGVDVLIATPGRLLDLFERGKILLRDIKVLVIDEADRMLDMGFIPDIERIVSLIPPIRQTLFFSATMPPEIRRLADKFLSNPKEITVSRPATTAANIEDFVVRVSDRDKRDALRGLLSKEEIKSALIFCNRKRDVDILHQSLKRHGFDAGALHGDMDQSRRTATLDKFRMGELPILVASDVAARGLDIDDISHVFNFDVPHNAEDYVHRIGRTGRAGRSGRAFTLVTPDDGKNLAAIESLIRRDITEFKANGAAAPGVPEAAPEAPEERSDERREERGGRRRRGRSRDRRDDGERPASARSEDRAPPPPRRSESRQEPRQEPRLESRHEPRQEPRQEPRAAEARRKESRHAPSGSAESGFGDSIPDFLRPRAR